MRFIVFRGKDGDWRWRLLAGNNRVIADSGEGYSAKNKVIDAVTRISTGAAQIAGAPLEIDNAVEIADLRSRRMTANAVQLGECVAGIAALAKA